MGEYRWVWVGIYVADLWYARVFTVNVGYCMTYDINLTHPLISARDDLLKSLNELEVLLEKVQSPVWIPAEWINPSITLE